MTEMSLHDRGVPPNTRDASAKTHRPSVTKHTGYLGHTLPTDTPPEGDSVTKHTGHLGQGTPAIGHQAHGTPPEGATPRLPTHLPKGTRSPNTPDTSAKTHRPSVTKHTGRFGQDTSATGHQAHGTTPERGHTSATGHQAHGTTPEGATHRPPVTKHTGQLPKGPHIGHRSPRTRDNSRRGHTSATGHQAHGTTPEGSTHRPQRPTHLLEGTRSPNTRDASYRGQCTSAIGHQAHGTPPELATHRPPTPLGLGFESPHRS